MIEILNGTHEERIIKILKKVYPITSSYIKEELNLSEKTVERVLKKFQVKGIVELDQLPGKLYVRLLRDDFSFIGKKNQRKFIKHKKKKQKEPEKYNGIMYS
jgi:predicted transcriptional regulator